MTELSKGRLKEHIRIAAAEIDPAGFKIGFELGRLSIEDPTYSQIHKALHYAPLGVEIAFTMGHRVASEAAQFSGDALKQELS